MNILCHGTQNNTGEIMDNLFFTLFKESLSDNEDVKFRDFCIFGHNIHLVFLDSMTSKTDLGHLVIRPLLSAAELPEEEDQLLEYLENSVISAADTKVIYDINKAKQQLFGGCALIFAENVKKVLYADIRMYPFRAVAPPDIEVSEFGSRESFIEVLNVNISMITRRLRTDKLRFENLNVGSTTNTRVVLCYLEDKAPKRLVEEVRKKILSANFEELFEAGSLKEVLQNKKHTLYNTLGMTVRPDVLSSKISEGRVAVMAEGSPEAVFAPYLLVEHLQTPDDYINRPYFALLTRTVKLISIIISIVLVGTYIALAQYNPEVFPSSIIYSIMNNAVSTPFSTATESVFLLLLYEMMREAGMRLPKSMGQSVSIVGSLVIGEAVVTAGLIGAPTVIVCALSAISSFITPDLYNQTSVLRILYIITGTASGIYGIALLSVFLFVCLCSVKSFSVPIVSPFAPLDKKGIRDSIFRVGYGRLGKKTADVNSLAGSEEE